MNKLSILALAAVFFAPGFVKADDMTKAGGSAASSSIEHVTTQANDASKPVMQKSTTMPSKKAAHKAKKAAQHAREAVKSQIK